MKRITALILALLMLSACAEKRQNYIEKKLKEELIIATYFNPNVELVFTSANDDSRQQLSPNAAGRLRRSKADRLLSETSMNISEIAYSVGFSSASYFSIIFSQALTRYPKNQNEISGKISK